MWAFSSRPTASFWTLIMVNLQAYDLLAWFYNKYWTIHAPELFADVLDEYFLPSLPENADILDLCCGTGQICAKLSADGYKVTGLDISEKMLNIAAVNAPSAEFVHADARYFILTEKFDAVFSMFDSINHMLSLDDLLLCFESVKQALKPGGLFLFDVNDAEVFSEIWENGFTMVEDDNICIMKPVFEPESGLAVYSITMLNAEGNLWYRKDATVYEQCHSPEEITKTLYKAGFSNIRVLEGEEDLGVSAFKGRIFFAAS